MGRLSVGLWLGAAWLLVLVVQSVSVLVLTAQGALAVGAGTGLVAIVVTVLAGLAGQRRQARERDEFAARLGSQADSLERALGIEAGFARLEGVSFVTGRDGRMLMGSGGLKRLAPEAVPGVRVDGLMAAPRLEDGRGLVALGGERFAMRKTDLDNGGMLVELSPAAHLIAEADLEAFTDALTGGQTGFRYSPQAVAANPALRGLNEAMAALDTSVKTIDQLVEGEDIGDPARLHANMGLTPQVMGIKAVLDVLSDAHAEESERREVLEGKIAAIGKLVEVYQQQASRMADMAGSLAAGTGAMRMANAGGRDRARAAAELGAGAQAIAGEASQAAQRTHGAVEDVDAVTVQIDAQVANVEDISYRINLLALNAAVEAARVGEKGAGFAVVAEEVRTLAQASNRAAKDIRTLVNKGREQSGASVAETLGLKKIIAGLAEHLQNLRNQTDTIAGTLDEGSGALDRLEGQAVAIEQAARKVLSKPS